MASLPATKLLHKNALFALLFLLSMASVFGVVSSHEFRVGGDRGWTKPTGNESETLNEWASRNRFHVGDTLYFNYQNDSVLVVNRTSYAECIVSDPIAEFAGGETVFMFDRFGFFYFISGDHDQCKSGQRLIVRVMVHPATIMAPEPAAAAPEEDGGSDDSGGNWDSIWHSPPAVNSTMKMSVASYFMTALGGMLVILYLLM